MSFALPSTETDVPELLRLRRIANQAFIAVLWALLALNTAVSFLTGMSAGLAFFVSMFGAVVGTGAYLRDRDGLVGRVTIAICLMNGYDVLIYATSYTPYQLDAHMLYFVLAALMIAYCCWATLLAACLHTAVQHLTFNLLLPFYLYPGGADWLRFVYHAIILIIQVVGSGFLAIQFHRLFSLSQRTVNELRATSAEAVEIRQREDQQRTVAQAERESARALALEASNRQQLVVDEIAAGLDNLAHGALDFRIVATFSAEYEKLRLNFNAAMDRIGDALSRVADNTGAIRSGTGEMSSTAEDLSRRAEQQSQSLKQTVASLDEVTNALNKTAKSASNARDVVAAAQGDAEKGTQVVGEAIGAMSGIEQSSKQIGQIIGVIDEIAFQTNLLALNAGVEAARAGDSGRGFAVVASEVRGLAQRSTDAAKQIKTLISASSNQVEQGVVLVRRTGEALQRIVGEIHKINSTVVEIAGSTREQSSSLGVINAAVNDIDAGVRTSADMFETSADATRRLAEQATELEQLLGFFRIGRDPAAHRRDRAYAPPQGQRRSA